MSRIALVPSEAIRARMAGIGIRYLELARRLPSHGFQVVLVTPGETSEVPELPDGAQARAFERGRLGEILWDCDVVVTQGQLANDVLIELPQTPTVVDFYDPFLVENLHYVDSLGLDPYRNDHATWVLQLSRGDFFLCSSDEQRQFYLGFLAALGRVNPYSVRHDSDLNGLIDVVPFGVPDQLPEHRPYLPERSPGEKRLLFGGLYDWYDPWPVLEALEAHRDAGWTLLLIRNPNPGTPQGLFTEVEAWCRKRGLWADEGSGNEQQSSRVEVLDWVPGERRYDLLRDVDLVVATHRLSLETRLSLRTRFLDALAADCPVVITEGGAMSRLLREFDAGWVVPEGDAEAVGRAFEDILAAGPNVESRRRAGRELLMSFSWNRVLEPLIRFCREPKLDGTKTQFAADVPTRAPADPLMFRARRKLRRLLNR